MAQFYTSSQAPFRLGTDSSSFINQLNTTGRSREMPTTIALAMAACAAVHMPGGEVESPEAYFLQNAGMNAADAVGVINELVPVDHRAALIISKQLFLIRYEMAYRPFGAFGYDRSKGLPSIFGLNAHLGSDYLDCMSSHAQEITTKYERFKQIIAELTKV